jgi:acyl dehydratase
MSLTGDDRFFEDYLPGHKFEHRRGHTVTTADNQMLSLLTMNTAQTHFNADSMTGYLGGQFAAPLLNACVALALAAGLTSEDMTENALADLGYPYFRMPAPLFVGDTIYAASEVLTTDEPSGRDDAGVLWYRFTARKTDGALVVDAERRALIKRRVPWQSRHEELAARVHDTAVQLLSDAPDRPHKEDV